MNDFALTPLWTDWMIWGLIASFAYLGVLVRRSRQVAQQWMRIFESKLALISAMILCIYLLIALLDSIHFQTTSAQQMTVHQSVLDKVFSHLAVGQERTYSAPFASTEHTKSLVVNQAGEMQQLRLPLKHIRQDADFSMIGQTLSAFLFASVLSGFVVGWHLLWRSRVHQCPFKDWLNQVLLGKTRLPWRTAYLTFWGLLTLFCWLWVMSHSVHVLGTDKVGSDVLYESMKSIRTGVLIGVLTTLVMLPLALFLGISAGLFKGWVDDVIQYIYTTLNSIPGVLLIAAAVLVMQVILSNHPDWFSSTEDRADIRLMFLIFILGLTSWTGLCRLLRAETLKLSAVDYVTAAKAFGVSRMTIIRRHILPNVMHIVLIAVVLDFSGLVLAEAVLSYVGVGVDPTMHSWGNMINQARLEMAREPMVWWSLFSAFIFMFVLVLAANLFSDRVQAVLDPRNQSDQLTR